MLPSLDIFVAEVLEQEVEVLLDPVILQGVVYEEADEDLGAEGTDLPGAVVDHHLLHSLNQIIDFYADEFLLNDGLEAAKGIWLDCEFLNVLAKDFY